MSREEAIGLLIIFFQDEFAEDPAGVAQAVGDIEELIEAIAKLKQELCILD